MNSLSKHLEQEAEYLKEEEQNIRVIARRRIAEIKSLICINEPLKILDCGSSHGFYLDEYRKEGWDAWGIESSLFYPFDSQVKCMPLENIAINTFPFKFDVITCFCILEHIETFNCMILILHRLLKPNGLLVVKAPYNKGLTGRFAKKKYYLDPTHVNEINNPKIFTIWGFKLIKTVIEGIHPERVFPRFGKTKIAKYLTEKLGLGDARCWYFKKQ